MKINNEIIIEQFKNVHGDKYDYSLVEYTKSDEPVNIICKKHGPFKQAPNHHKRGSNCRRCVIEKSKYTTEQIIKQFKNVHGDRYDYSKTVYTLSGENVDIICKRHGSFPQQANNHLQGKGCPRCKESKGETLIRHYLEKNNIKYKKEKHFNDCIYQTYLKFDFYLPDLNTCIEYDGIQHFIAIDYFGGEEILSETKIKDNIKNEYCKTNNIRLIRIPYTKIKNISNILDELNV